MFSNFQLWKLHSAGDYATFFLYLLAGLTIFWFWNRRIKKGRNDADANKRVVNKLAKFGTVATPAELALPTGASAVLTAPFGVVVVRTIGWGTHVLGSMRNKTWQLAHQDEVRVVDNPYLKLDAPVDEVQTRLFDARLREVPVYRLIVCADPFDTPVLNIERGANTITLKDLKGYLKAIPAASHDVAAMLAALRKPNSKENENDQ